MLFCTPNDACSQSHPFTRLPAELHLCIIDHLAAQCDKVALMNCSSYFYALAVSRVFHTVILRCPTKITQFLDHVSCQPHFARIIRSLHICPEFLMDGIIIGRPLESSWYYNLSVQTSKAIPCLKNLITLNIPEFGVWSPNYPTLEWTRMGHIPNVVVRTSETSMTWLAVRDATRTPPGDECEQWEKLIKDWKPTRYAHTCLHDDLPEDCKCFDGFVELHGSSISALVIHDEFFFERKCLDPALPSKWAHLQRLEVQSSNGNLPGPVTLLQQGYFPELKVVIFKDLCPEDKLQRKIWITDTHKLLESFSASRSLEIFVDHTSMVWKKQKGSWTADPEFRLEREWYETPEL